MFVSPPTRDQYSIDRLYNRTSQDLLCKTAYPYHAAYFSDFRSEADIMKSVTDISVYLHIPFCQSLCHFCEYTRFLSESPEEQHHYIRLLRSEIEKYLQLHTIDTLFGLDIGGGTPTALRLSAFEELLSLSDGIQKSASSLAPDSEHPAQSPPYSGLQRPSENIYRNVILLKRELVYENCAPDIVPEQTTHKASDWQRIA